MKIQQSHKQTETIIYTYEIHHFSALCTLPLVSKRDNETHSCYLFNYRNNVLSSTLSGPDMGSHFTRGIRHLQQRKSSCFILDAKPSLALRL